MVVALKHCGTTACLREMLKISTRISDSWSAQAVTHLGTLSGPAAFCGLTLAIVVLMLAADRNSTQLTGGMWSSALARCSGPQTGRSTG